jgi:hypothetical protein
LELEGRDGGKGVQLVAKYTWETELHMFSSRMMGKSEELPEHTAPKQGLLVISWVDGFVVVRL